MKWIAGPGSCLTVVLAVILLLAFLVYACIPYSPTAASELRGRYVLDCELMHGELALHPDGTFAETVTIKATSDVATANGTWAYNSGDHYVTFEGLLRVLRRPDEVDPGYANAPLGVSLLPAEYWFGRLRIGGSVDSWPDWEKVD